MEKEKIITIEYVKDGLRTKKTPFHIQSKFYDSVFITVQEKDKIGIWNTTQEIEIPVKTN